MICTIPSRGCTEPGGLTYFHTLLQYLQMCNNINQTIAFVLLIIEPACPFSNHLQKSLCNLVFIYPLPDLRLSKTNASQVYFGNEHQQIPSNYHKDINRLQVNQSATINSGHEKRDEKITLSFLVYNGNKANQVQPNTEWTLRWFWSDWQLCFLHEQSSVSEQEKMPKLLRWQFRLFHCYHFCFLRARSFVRRKLGTA